MGPDPQCRGRGAHLVNGGPGGPLVPATHLPGASMERVPPLCPVVSLLIFCDSPQGLASEPAHIKFTCILFVGNGSLTEPGSQLQFAGRLPVAEKSVGNEFLPARISHCAECLH